jgi:CBS domain-containing protein
MAQTIQDVMTPSPTCMDSGTTLPRAAQAMRDGDIGDVLVTSNGQLQGIVTDRDLVIRGMAELPDVEHATLGDVCTPSPITVAPETPVADAVALMRQEAIRRLPVVREGEPVGIVSLGDLAIEREGNSLLADISAAPANA